MQIQDRLRVKKTCYDFHFELLHELLYMPLMLFLASVFFERRWLHNHFTLTYDVMGLFG
jgi:hypothetical protein